MPIYSNNRLRSVTEGYRARSGYDMNSYARILYECALNDYAIFEAAIISDIAEVTAIRTGRMTLREAEEEGSSKAKQIVDGLVRSLESFLEKVKGLTRTASKKIQELSVKNMKVFNALYKKKIEAYFEAGNGPIKLEKPVEYIEDLGDITSIYTDYQDENVELIEKMVSTINKNNAEYFEKFLAGMEKANDGFEDSLRDEAVSTVDSISSSNLDELVSFVVNGNRVVTIMNNIEKRVENVIKDRIKELKELYNESEDDGDSPDFMKLKSVLTKYQGVSLLNIHATIDVIMDCMKSTRGGLVEAAHKATEKVEDGVQESSFVDIAMCWLESDAEVAEVVDAPPTEPSPTDSAPVPDTPSETDDDDEIDKKTGETKSNPTNVPDSPDDMDDEPSAPVPNTPPSPSVDVRIDRDNDGDFDDDDIDTDVDSDLEDNDMDDDDDEDEIDINVDGEDNQPTSININISVG